MDGLLALPLSAVEPDWIHTEFRPRLQQALTTQKGGRILWLVVDAGTEGDYLLSDLEAWARSSKRSVEWVKVWDDDPFLLWEDLLGTPDEPPANWHWPEGTIVCTENSVSLPVQFVRDRSSFLARYCRVRGWFVVMPILREAIRYIRQPEEESAQLVVPAFGDTSTVRRQALAEAMIRAGLPSISEDLTQSLLIQLLQTDPPARSRAELQAWCRFLPRPTRSRRGAPPHSTAADTPSLRPSPGDSNRKQSAR